MLTASRFHGKEAGEYGIADFVTDNSNELRTVEIEIKKNIYKCAPGANSITKEIVLATRKLEGDALRKFAAKGFAKAMMSDEGKEGIAAFVEKRKPKWSE
jgi:isohexenylglutaconyl-CoA hydratase